MTKVWEMSWYYLESKEDGPAEGGEFWMHDHCDHDDDPADTAACEIDSALAEMEQCLDDATTGDPRLQELTFNVNRLRESWTKLCVPTQPVAPAVEQGSAEVEAIMGRCGGLVPYLRAVIADTERHIHNCVYIEVRTLAVIAETLSLSAAPSLPESSCAERHPEGFLGACGMDCDVAFPDPDAPSTPAPVEQGREPLCDHADAHKVDKS